MLRDYTTPICPLPGLGQCVRERCNFWDEEQEGCAGDCYETCDPIDATSKPDLETPCVISFEEDYD
ncbi:MAG: hypothetical protein WBV23_09965 [Desulfobaccales bacterium]